MLNDRKPRGFTLLEVLITVLVLSIGLLGLAGLQITGLKNDQSAYYRSQATMLAYDILDVLRSNRQVARDGSYNIAMDASPPSGDTRSDQDLNHWLNELTNRLPRGDGSVNIVNDRVTIIVQWDDSRGTEAARQFVVESQL
ncbi:MAG: type IV pilus modification protein PilV [Methylococcaceae bacterium]|nr:type IV pilus modification protein PilV [Methylococcaceae bacterium]